MKTSGRRASLAVAVTLLLGAVATVVGVVQPASAGTFTTSDVAGTLQLNDVTCVSSTTCVAVGSSASSQGAAAVEIVNGVPGTVATTTDTNADRLDRVVCVSATSCIASGVGQTGGEVIPITLDGQATLGTPQYVSNTFELFGLACSSATTCVAVGGTAFSSSQGAVVDIVNGVAQPEQSVAGVNQFLAVGCLSSTTCVATASYAYVSADVITNGVPSATVSSGDDGINVRGMTCTPATCVVVGYDGNPAPDGSYPELGTYFTVSAGGVIGAAHDATGTRGFNSVTCPTSTCVAVGQYDASGSPEQAEVVTVVPGAAPGAPQLDPSASSFSGVSCTAALACVLSGDGTGNNGVVATTSITAPTATLTGTVSIAKAGGTTTLADAPVQACATDGSYCGGGVSSGADGSYSIDVPSGETYVVTGFSPAGDNYSAGVSASVAATTTGQTYAGNDVTLTPGPGLGAGVSVTGFGAAQNSGTAVPTVNWGSPFSVTLAPSVFSTPAGDTSTLLTLTLTATNTQTGTVQAKTIYAGGQITVNGQPAAVGLPVDPAKGVTIQIPALQPLHGPAGMSITWSDSPVPATGVTAAPQPLILSNGNPTSSVTVAATDAGVDHTVGTATLAGGDSSVFTIGTPNCAGSTLVQNSGGTSPNASCAIPVTWHAPATPSKNAYASTVDIPVTNSSGQQGILQDTVYACDSRILGNSQCQQGNPPTPPSPTATGGGYGTPIGGIYIDPSGTVVTPVAGGGTAPVSGATVTLAMQDPATSAFSAVPDGSAVMSPANRTNPVTTGADGAFAWDTVAGTYEITAAKSGCSNSPQTTSPVTVPPAATGLVITLDCTASQAATTTTLTSTPAAPATGAAVTLVASVTGSSPSGTVTFTDGAATLGSANVDSSTGQATLALGSLAPGGHSITAAYGGDAGNAASHSTAASVTVAAPAPVATTTTVTAAPAASTQGQAVAYSAVVAPASGSAAPTGTVTFAVAGTVLCQAAVTSAGPGSPAFAACSAANAPVGAGTVVATYPGDTSFSGSAGTATETVTAPAPPPPPPALSVKTSSLAGGVKGKAYSASLASAGGTGSFSWSVATGKLPAGLKLSAAGKLTGKPTKAGSYSFTVQVSDTAGQAATRKLSVKVAAIAVKNTSLAAGKKAHRYSVKLGVYGGSGALTWNHSGSLPAGLTLSKSGALTGTPTRSGTFTVTIKVKDHTGATASVKLKLVIRAG